MQQEVPQKARKVCGYSYVMRPESAVCSVQATCVPPRTADLNKPLGLRKSAGGTGIRGSGKDIIGSDISAWLQSQGVHEFRSWRGPQMPPRLTLSFTDGETE